jgi:hypothetical protein
MSEQILIKRIKKRNQQRVYQRGIRQKVLTKLGGRCVECGETDWRTLQIDHIGGGGTKHHDSVGCQTYYRKIILGDINPYRLLCANCNLKKSYEHNENMNRNSLNECINTAKQVSKITKLKITKQPFKPIKPTKPCEHIGKLIVNPYNGNNIMICCVCGVLLFKGD